MTDHAASYVKRATGEQNYSKTEWLSLRDSGRRGERGAVKLESDGEGDEGGLARTTK